MLQSGAMLKTKQLIRLSNVEHTQEGNIDRVVSEEKNFFDRNNIG